MAHPNKEQAKSTSASKFRAMTGQSSPGRTHPDESPDGKARKAMLSPYDMKADGGRAKGRMDGGAVGYKRGGRTGKVNINIVTGGPPPPPAGPLGLPAGLPPVAAGGPPSMPPPGLGGPPGLKPPGMKSGGRLGMTAGAESGKGRLQKAEKYGLKPK